MPQTYPARAARWPGSDDEAMRFLRSRGYQLGNDWHWTHPDPEKSMTARETDAEWFLIEEWDFGFFRAGPTQYRPHYTEKEYEEAAREHKS